MKNIKKKLLFIGLVLTITLSVMINDTTTTNQINNNNIKQEQTKSESTNKIKPYDRLKSYLNLLSNQAFADEFISEADGTKIETNTIAWIRDDGSTTNDNLVVTKHTWGSDKVNIRSRINIALSGETPYKEGDIKIKIPKKIFDSRYERLKISEIISFSVPKLPDKSQPFAYFEENDYYVIVNTKELSPATQASFELTRSVSPVLGIKDISSGYYSSPFYSIVEVKTHKNNIIKMKSNEIKAGLDTMAKLRSNNLGASKIEYNDIPDELKPNENIKDHYIYIRYTGSYTAYYSQDFKILSNFSINDTPESKDYKILGSKRWDYITYNYEISKNKYEGFENYINGSLQNADYPDFKYSDDIYLFVAYPKKNLIENKTYTFGAKIKNTIISTDDKEESNGEREVLYHYKNIKFQKPNWDNETIARKKLDSWNYIKFLNVLLKDGFIDIKFNLESSVLGMNKTFTGGNPNNIENYNKKEYEAESHDYKLEMDGLGLLKEDEYEFKSVELSVRELVYAKSENGEWSLRSNKPKNNNTSGSFMGYKDGKWIEFATITFLDKDNYLSMNMIPKNGASQNSYGSILFLPENVTQYKIKLFTKGDAININSNPIVRLKPSSRIKKYIQSKYQSNKKLYEQIRVVNYAKTNLIQDGNLQSSNESTASDVLVGTQMNITLNKNSSFQNNLNQQKTLLDYTLNHSHLTKVNNNSSAKYSHEDIDYLVKKGAIDIEKNITFYDLLPKGVIPIKSSIKTYGDKKIKNIKVIENYKGSERIMLIVNVENQKEKNYDSLETKLNFKAYYPFDAIDEYGKVLVNIAASESDLVFDTGTGAYESARPDKPDYYSFYNSADKEKDNELMTNLNPNHDNKSFAYSSIRNDINVDRYSLTSLKKEVDVNKEDSYSNGLTNELPKNVKEGGVYTYRLKIKNPDNSKSENIVLYDKLEGYTPTEDKEDYKDTQWTGELLNIDTSQIEKLNAKPVIYYSTKENIILDDTNNRSDNDLTKSEIWATTKPTDKKITAIAIDLRKKKDGSDFVLEYNQKLYVDINMKAPILKGQNKDKYYDTEIKDGEKEEGLTGGAHAYNNAVSTLTSFAKETNTKSENLLIRNDYTKVGIKKNEIKVQKIWDDDEDRDRLRPNEIKINLIKNNETIKSIKLNEENKWFYNFGNQPTLDENNKPVDYRVEEETIPNGYSQSTEYENVEDGTLFKIKNQHDVEKVKIKVKKIYDENVNYTPSVKIKILGDGQVVKKINLPEYSNWYTDFISLPKYNKGKEIKYEVKEDYIEDFIPEYSKDGETVTIYNKYHPYGDLKISKTVVDAPNLDKNKSFSFKFIMKDQNSNPDDTLYNYEKSDSSHGQIKNGDTIKLKHNENITIKNIKKKNQYTITEIIDPNYRPEKETISGTIESNTTQEANFKNIGVKINMPISGQKGISLGLSLGVLLTLTSALYYRSKNKI